MPRWLCLFVTSALLGLASAAELVDVDGPALQKAIAAYDAKVKVVNVWATWCVPCRVEFPHFVKLHKTYRERGIAVLFVSADFADATQETKAFLAKEGVTWASYRKVEGEDEAFINSLSKTWSGALPATFVYDERDQLITAWEGQVDYAELEKRVLAVLRPPAPLPVEPQPHPVPNQGAQE